MRSYIKVSNELRKELQVKFKKTRKSVYNALAYITTGESANSIREYALAHGGKYEEEDFIPNCNTRYEGDLMIHAFSCGIEVTVSIKDSHCEVTRNGQTIESYDGLTLRGWGNVLAQAQALSNELVANTARM